MTTEQMRWPMPLVWLRKGEEITASFGLLAISEDGYPAFPNSQEELAGPIQHLPSFWLTTIRVKDFLKGQTLCTVSEGFSHPTIETYDSLDWVKETLFGT